MPQYRSADEEPARRVPARDVAPLGAAIGAYGITMAFLSTTTSLFLADAVHATALLIGMFFVVRGLVAIPINVISGRLSDRLSDRRVLILTGGVAQAAGAACFTVLRGYPEILVTGALLVGLGGMCFTQLFAYSSELAAARGRPVMPFTSAMRSLLSAAWVAGPPAGLFLLTRYGFAPLYLTTAGLSLVTAALGGWGLRRIPTQAKTAEPAAIPESAVVIPVTAGVPEAAGVPPLLAAAPTPRKRILPALPVRLWLLIAAVVVVGMVNQVYGINIALYVTKDLHHGAQLVGWMAAACAGLEVPVMIVAGHLAGRLGRTRLVIASALGATAFFCLLPLASSASALLGLQVLNAAWVGIALSLPMVMIQDEAPGGVGQSSSLYSSAFTVAQLLAGAIAGVTASAIGFGNVFWVCAALCAVATGLLVARALPLADRSAKAAAEAAQQRH